MRAHTAAVFGILVPVALGSAWAADDDRGKKNWDGQISLSAASATGNTENTVLGLEFEARRVLGRYTHDIRSGASYVETASDNDDGTRTRERTSDRWYAQYRGEVQSGDKTFVYGRVRYEEDAFSGYESKVFVGGGIGHTKVDNKAMKWSLLAGPGYQYSPLERGEDGDDSDDEAAESEFAFYAGSDFRWEMRENVTLENKVDTTWANTSTTLETNVALKTKLTDTIATRLNYVVKHETDPPEDTEETDTLLSAAVVFGF